MSLNLSGFPKRLLALAILLALALTFSIAGGAHAASVNAPESAINPSSLCLSVTPATQQIAVGQTAHVTVMVSCSFGSPSVVTVIWGDGGISQYFACEQTCHVLIDATHVYGARGTYHPESCLVPPPPGATSDCTTVEIVVG